MKIIAFGGTDPGKRRSNNEDAFLVSDKLLLYAVADGIGGNEGGEVASRMAVETLAKVMENSFQLPKGTPSSDDEQILAFEQAIMAANLQIREARTKDPNLASMGTTLTALFLGGKSAIIANLGDSRAYLLRSGLFKQLTLDHSFVAEYVAAGLLTIEQAKVSPYRHIITRALGIDEVAKADFTELTVQADDRILLCTDGLTEMIEDSEIFKIISRSSPQDAVQQLIALSNDKGGVDNITVVAVWVVEV